MIIIGASHAVYAIIQYIKANQIKNLFQEIAWHRSGGWLLGERSFERMVFSGVCHSDECDRIDIFMTFPIPGECDSLLDLCE